MKKMNYNLPLESDEHTAGFIKRIFHLTKQTLMEHNVPSVCMQLGLQYNSEETPDLLHLDEGVLRESSGFISLWENDYPPERLLYKRRNSPFGWVNKMMRPEWNQ
jgi:hypothetical protein